MPRFSVEHNGKWACFSTIVDVFVTDFMDKAEYEKWRLEEYGRANYEPAENCNMWTIVEAVEDASLYHSKEKVIENLIKHGINKEEAEELWNSYKLDPEEEDDS